MPVTRQPVGKLPVITKAEMSADDQRALSDSTPYQEILRRTGNAAVSLDQAWV